MCMPRAGFRTAAPAAGGRNARASPIRSGIPPDADAALRLALTLGAPGRRATLLWQIARALFRLGFAASLAIFTGVLIVAGTFSELALVAMLITLAVSAVAGYGADLRAARAETALANALRSALEEALDKMSPVHARSRPAGQLIAGLQRHPERLASLAISHGAARSMLIIGPLVAVAALCIVSWQAALTLLLSIPVMGIFFFLLGGAVKSRAEAQERAFGRLAAQFADRIRTLPTILANHALDREHLKIEQRMSAYAASMMRVLTVAFLNAGVIDLFSALSIAVLAVLLGLGHLGLIARAGFSGLQLWQSLLILLIAADYFTPIRRYAEQYHIKAEGEAAARELDWYFGAAVDGGTADNGQARSPLAADGAEGFDIAALPQSGLIAISGPSGAGKSTLLRMLAGIEPPTPGATALPQVTVSGCVWMATDIYVPAGTLADAIAWNRAGVKRQALEQAAETVGLNDDLLLPGGLDARVAEGGANLSGGQRLRIGIARILIAPGVVFADEPTAKLDSATASLVRQALTDIAHRRLVLVATHDERLIAAADRHHVLSLPKQPAIAA